MPDLNTSMYALKNNARLIHLKENIIRVCHLLFFKFIKMNWFFINFEKLKLNSNLK